MKIICALTDDRLIVHGRRKEFQRKFSPKSGKSLTHEKLVGWRIYAKIFRPQRSTEKEKKFLFCYEVITSVPHLFRFMEYTSCHSVAKIDNIKVTGKKRRHLTEGIVKSFVVRMWSEQSVEGFHYAENDTLQESFDKMT